jgi:HlyD family secretion protein
VRQAEAQAQVDLRKALVDKAKLDVDKHVLHAPFPGVVARLDVEEGEWAVPGKPVAQLSDPTRLYVVAEIDEVDMARLREDLSVRIRFDPLREKKYPGRVTRVGDVVSEIELQNRTVKIEVEADMPLSELGLKPGTSADVEVILQKKDNVLRLPRVALLEGNRVLVCRNSHAEAVSIVPGVKSWDFVEVVSGIDLGTNIIVNLEDDRVKEGVRVEPKAEPFPAP